MRVDGHHHFGITMRDLFLWCCFMLVRPFESPLVMSGSNGSLEHCPFTLMPLECKRRDRRERERREEKRGERSVKHHLFVGGHDPLDGVSSRGQEIACGGEGLCPLAHQHLSLTVGSLCERGN